MDEFTLPVSAEKFVPHRETMLFLDELNEYCGGVVSTRAVFAPAHPFVDERGEVDAVAMVEMLAQTAAVLKGYEVSQVEQLPHIGYLAGIKQFEFKSCLRAGREVRIEARETFSMDQVAMIDGRILEGEDCLAAGTLKVWASTKAIRTPPTPAGDICAKTKEPIDTSMRPTAASSPIHQAVLNSTIAHEISMTNQRTVGKFCFDDSFLGFCGHFPGRPILPGIIILKAALITCEHDLGRLLKLNEVVRAKFSSAVSPHQVIRIEVTTSPGDVRWEARAVVRRGEERVADVRLILESADD